MPDPSADAASRREQRRRRHQHFSREQFLDAAEEVFGRKGYFATTLKEVAELAEYSVGSVYSFFENKEDLFTQIWVRRGGTFMEELRETLADERGDPAAELHRLVDFEVRWFRRHPHFGRLYLRHAGAGFLVSAASDDQVVMANFRESMALQGGLIARGQVLGVFRPGDPEALARMFSGVMATFQSLDPQVMSDDPDAPERMDLDELHDLVDRMFLVEPGRG